MNLKTGVSMEGRPHVGGMATAEPTTSKGRAGMANGGGDLRWSFERIYEDFRTPIANYIYHLVGNRDQAEDLAHDTFLKAFKALPKMDSNLKLSAWLYRIATNTAYDTLRRRKLIGFLPWDDLDHEPPDSESADPQEKIGTTELVRETLKRMPTQYRAALLLYIQQGLSYAEIAESLGVSVSAVETLIFRGRRYLADALRGAEPEPQLLAAA